MAESFRSAESICPVCLATVPAALLAEGDNVTLEGRCPDHGSWQTCVWRGAPSLESWCGGISTAPAQQTCTVVLEVTLRCDLGCPVCFAESGPTSAEPDPPLPRLTEMLEHLYKSEGAVNLQLSGGEPTLREDLPEVIAAACAAGFTFVQLNTNGLRLAAEEGYAERLRGAGLVSVFLQFDGVTDETYRALRGRPLAKKKLRALERCAEAGLAVVLVPTVVPGINQHELGSLVRLATAWPGVVRGLHLQPVSYFGRYPGSPLARLTLPEALDLLEEQTRGEVSETDFAPSCCEHARCSFRARYWVRDGGRLEVVRSESSCCGPQPGEASRRAVAATSRQWSRRPRGPGDMGAQPAEGQLRCASPADPQPRDGLDRFLEEADRMLTISGMLFQDAWSVDLERVRRCCVKSLTPDGGLVSFCMWNLTSESGRRFYPRGERPR